VTCGDAFDGERLVGRECVLIAEIGETVGVNEGWLGHRLSLSFIQSTVPLRRTHNIDNLAKETIVSLVRVLPAWLHAVADYAVGLSLIIVAIAAGAAGADGKAVAIGVVVGAVVLLVSMLTKYPLGVAKVLPFTVHSAGDYLAAALLIISPFALSINRDEPGLTAFYVIAGLAVLAVSLVTNYQYGEKRSWNQSAVKATPATA
jgi:hypothetical protein